MLQDCLSLALYQILSHVKDQDYTVSTETHETLGVNPTNLVVKLLDKPLDLSFPEFDMIILIESAHDVW